MTSNQSQVWPLISNQAQFWFNPSLNQFSTFTQQYHLQHAVHGDLDVGLHSNTIEILSPCYPPKHLAHVEDMAVEYSW